ncbi:MarR family winged helix-turn-helix transcriptional regulator [Pararhizobium haloflavum]|uniref:MarR family winged helix-turn-helix transcriptional regulator n=1 Tax=Pararhizobium haloflavum TaxID=2037914 RepID=UPI000C19916D|nr:MarR family transcriptional regulator [Pararhizobium haloflavum]
MAKKDKKADGKKRKDGAAEQDGAFAATLAQTARSVRTRLTLHLTECGLYAGQDSVIMSLAEEDGQSPGMIAERLGVRAPTITKTISRLAAQGFVERRDSSDDGRKAAIFLTGQGQEAVGTIRRAVRLTEQSMLEGLSGKEARNLLKLLRRLDQNLQQ